MNYEFKGTKDKWVACVHSTNEHTYCNIYTEHTRGHLNKSGANYRGDSDEVDNIDIVRYQFKDGDMPLEEFNANMALIASAPELLEALKETLNCNLPEDVELQVKQAIHKALNIQP